MELMPLFLPLPLFTRRLDSFLSGSAIRRRLFVCLFVLGQYHASHWCTVEASVSGHSRRHSVETEKVSPAQLKLAAAYGNDSRMRGVH